MDELQRVHQRPVRPELEEPPSKEELLRAILKIKNGKASGEHGILPEMLKAASHGDEFMSRLLDLVHDVWKLGSVPGDWRDAILIPIPKKGDLSNCDNWRGISLLDIVGKAVARVLQDRLQKIAEDELPESQCGFRKGRGCTDMIFVVRQLVEKSWEHNSKAFFSFIDLKKAYDSVPREALWLALGKLGVPDLIVGLIKSFHQDMRARIRLDGTMMEGIDVWNGLRQGCCMAPVLFNLYTCLVVERWLSKVEGNEGVGIIAHYKLDQRLFRRYIKNASVQWITECLFADDGALLASTRSGAECAVVNYQQVSKDFGLTVSIPKTKHMVTGRLVDESDKEPIILVGGDIEAVDEFPYLGSLITSSGRMDMDIDRRIAQASKAFGALRKAVFLDRNLSLSTKRRIYTACVLSVLLYGAECWTPLVKHYRKLNTFHHRCIRIILGITNRQQWFQHITMAEVRRRWGDTMTMNSRVALKRLEWLGHLSRMPDNRLPKRVLFSWFPQPRPKCGPRKRWRDVIQKDLIHIHIGEDKWYEAASSRTEWRTLYHSGTEQEDTTVERPLIARHVLCDICNRTFSRESDKKRHKCIEERGKPISEQQGAAQCPQCFKWFRSEGGRAVHRCVPDN